MTHVRYLCGQIQACAGGGSIDKILVIISATWRGKTRARNGSVVRI